MTLEAILSMIGAATGIFGAAISIYDICNNRILAVNQYMEALEEEDCLEARSYIYNSDPENIQLDDKKAALVVNFFHHWGLLARKHYLPIWVFDSGSGSGVIRLYERTEPFIRKRREHDRDDTYASNFSWLYKELKRRRIWKKW